jgi:hypothetical protein
MMMRALESSTDRRGAVRRLPRCASLFALSMMVATSACSTPIAIGAMVVGTGSFVAGAVGYEECDDDSNDGPVGALCGLSNVMPLIGMVVGSLLVAGGGIGLLVEHQ